MQLLVVIASTRPGRIGAPIGEWFARAAKEHGGFDVRVADLAELNLPMFDEPEHPRFGRYHHDHTRDWAAIVGAADAVVFVMPEYNHSFTAPLKNALDYLHAEWNYKPAGFVSYGGIAAGTRAVQALKPVLAALRVTPVNEAVAVPMPMTMLRDGAFEPPEPVTASVAPMLDELAKLAGALAPLRGTA